MAIADNLTVQPNVAFDVDLEPTLRAVDIKANGSLFVIDLEGNAVDYTFDTAALNTQLPHRLTLRIRRVVGNGSGGVGDGATGSDLALSEIVGLH